MKRIIVFSLLCIFLAGCGAQKAEQKHNSPEPSETTYEGDAAYSEPVESSNFDAEYSAYLAEQEQLQSEIESSLNNTNLPIWSNLSDDIPSGSYTIEYQRELLGRSFVGYTDYFDIIEKNNKIFVKTDEFEACYGVMYIEITEEQLKSILTQDNSNGFICSFTVTNVCDYDMEIATDQAENGENSYISVDGVTMYLIIYATCNEIYKFV